MPSGEVPIVLNGAAELQALAKTMRTASPQFRKEFYAGLTRAARPMKEAAQREALTLPAGGGRGVRKTRTNRKTGVTKKTAGFKTGDSVAARAAGANYTIRSKGTGKNPTVTLQATPRKGRSVNLKALDRGELRHPLFGNRKHWYVQRVSPGWFSRPVDRNVEGVRTELLKAIDDAKRNLNL